MRTFETGATRDTATNKPDYEGFLSPDVLVEFGAYMLRHQTQPDGAIRTSDNWQKGMPMPVYIKSLFRHFVDLWRIHRGAVVLDPKTNKPVTVEEACCAIIFNVQGYLHEFLKARRQKEFGPIGDGFLDRMALLDSEVIREEKEFKRLQSFKKTVSAAIAKRPPAKPGCGCEIGEARRDGVPVTHDLNPE